MPLRGRTPSTLTAVGSSVPKGTGFRNQVRNLEERRIAVVPAVFERP
ncbi:MAG TPA: hypothetical protein VG370_22695 [Chloroflexota bacterium]|nr:hypothetical protein [Chloroflexota bacterium]